MRKNKKFSAQADASSNAPAALANTAASLAEGLYRNQMAFVHAPNDKHKVVPEVIVTIGYRLEPIKKG